MGPPRLLRTRHRATIAASALLSAHRRCSAPFLAAVRRFSSLLAQSEYFSRSIRRWSSESNHLLFTSGVVFLAGTWTALFSDGPMHLDGVFSCWWTQDSHWHFERTIGRGDSLSFCVYITTFVSFTGPFNPRPGRGGGQILPSHHVFRRCQEN